MQESEASTVKAFGALDIAIESSKYEQDEAFNRSISIFALFLATISVISTVISILEFSINKDVFNIHQK
ncbi:hypothetical protein OEG84_22105 [Hoeflea sp. G2-23]|uniref:Uncharacterized protein n=1 Tax=Hoeflea algicola TaxID=2983763 RepID=A0ABT3ZEV2_9HYPH|nr:hypothetical protein [Hoeflea algicola]MCY0150325.1 hypothetical protein [Hoeflea algicola]